MTRDELVENVRNCLMELSKKNGIPVTDEYIEMTVVALMSGGPCHFMVPGTKYVTSDMNVPVYTLHASGYVYDSDRISALCSQLAELSDLLKSGSDDETDGN